MRTRKHEQREEFKASEELNRIRKKYPRKRRLIYVSKLDKHAHEILSLRHEGASSNEIAAYLFDRHKLQVSHSTVLRFLKRRS